MKFPLELFILDQTRTKIYGAEIWRRLERIGYEIDPILLYSIVRTLEGSGFIERDRNKDRYQITELGKKKLETYIKENENEAS